MNVSYHWQSDDTVGPNDSRARQVGLLPYRDEETVCRSDNVGWVNLDPAQGWVGLSLGIRNRT